jgi:L-threonylcarbamoyladenylate synthase
MIQSCTGLKVLGHDKVGEEQLSNDSVVDGQVMRVSGSLDSHYAPQATVILDESPVAGQGFIAMADVVAVEGVVRLAAPKTYEEFARVLYAALRGADEQGLMQVVVHQPQGDGIAIAIRDRLMRAAHFETDK